MGGTIFIVEDNPTMSDVISWRALEVGFITVGSALDYRGTMEKLLVFSPDQRPDIIIMDILLSGEKDGIDTAIEVQELYDIPIVYISSNLDDPIVERARMTRPQGFIVKPFTDIQLKATLEMALLNKRSFGLQGDGLNS
ncbi:MAG TPA: response regulator [Methanospirillum sp.]|nr:response regulator [Methanospirillum sp.]